MCENLKSYYQLTNTPGQIQAQFDLAIAIILSDWPALTLAVQNQWGGPDSADKRDWLAGVISDLFINQPNTDSADIEDLLLQVLQDEFEVNLEDESEGHVAESIFRLRQETARGDFRTVNALHADWLRRKEGKGLSSQPKVFEQRQGDGGSGSEEEEDDDSDENDDADGDGDVAMHEASGGASSKPEPEVDENGFTKVVGKKRR